MSTRAIQSRDNALFQELRRLEHSVKERRQSGLALIEGPHLLQAFSAASSACAHIVAVGESALARPAIRELFHATEANTKVVLSDALISVVSQVVTSQGLLAVIPLPTTPQPATVGADALLLDRVQDPGNLGSILRTALAAGVREVFLSSGTVDAWNPKVLRAGMGAHFGLCLHLDVPLSEAIKTIGTRSFATRIGATRSLYDLDLMDPAAWVFGNEGAGVSVDVADAESICIPMPGGTESLNVAAAVAVCLFEQLRQRRDASARSQ